MICIASIMSSLHGDEPEPPSNSESSLPAQGPQRILVVESRPALIRALELRPAGAENCIAKPLKNHRRQRFEYRGDLPRTLLPFLDPLQTDRTTHRPARQYPLS